MGRFAYLPTNSWVGLGVNVSKYTIPSFPTKGQLDYCFFPKNLQQDPLWTDPEKTWVPNSSIATYLGVRW